MYGLLSSISSACAAFGWTKARHTGVQASSHNIKMPQAVTCMSIPVADTRKDNERAERRMRFSAARSTMQHYKELSELIARQASWKCLKNPALKAVWLQLLDSQYREGGWDRVHSALFAQLFAPDAVYKEYVEGCLDCHIDRQNARVDQWLVEMLARCEREIASLVRAEGIREGLEVQRTSSRAGGVGRKSVPLRALPAPVFSSRRTVRPMHVRRRAGNDVSGPVVGVRHLAVRCSVL